MIFVPDENDPDVQKLIEIIDPTHDADYVYVSPELDAELLDCFRIVERKVQIAGGKIIYGWQIWKSPHLVEAECHAVWEDNVGNLLDITPKEININRILFIEDENIKYNRRQIDNIRLNITSNKLVDDFIEVNKIIFDFKNRGARADSYDLSNILSKEQEDHLVYIDSIRHLIAGILGDGGDRDSLCLCFSGKKFKNCHGNNLLKGLLAIK